MGPKPVLFSPPYRGISPPSSPQTKGGFRGKRDFQIYPPPNLLLGGKIINFPGKGPKMCALITSNQVGPLDG